MFSLAWYQAILLNQYRFMSSFDKYNEFLEHEAENQNDFLKKYIHLS